MKRLNAAIALSLLLVCQTASAMESVTWNFRTDVPAGLAPQNLTTVEATTEGLYVKTSTDGFIQLPPLTKPADSLVLTLTNVDTPQLALIWTMPDLAPGTYYQSEILLPTGNTKKATLVLHQIPEWSWTATNLALAFPAGAEVLVKQMEWKSYSGVEKIWNGMLSYWTPDTFTLYSINFLWGPLIGTTPEARATLFETLPPRSWSATRFMYGILLVTGVAAGAALWNKPNGKKRTIAIIAITGSILWILFDARMTLEVLNYARHDWNTYVLAAPGERELRTHRRLYDTLNDIDALLGEDPSYVLLENDLGPYFANTRYKLYPAKPMTPEDRGDATAWVILGMPDILVENDALIKKDGTVLVPRGELVKQFEDYSFFYRALP